MFTTFQAIFLLGIQSHSFFINNDTEFSAVYESQKNTVKIRWKHNVTGIKMYIIQRSPDNARWSDIALREINQYTGIKTFYYEDKQPAPGENYYRLKYITIADNAEYSLGVMVSAATPAYNWVMFPVPVRDLLMLHYKGTAIIKGVITVLIQNSSGKIITRVRSASLNKIIQIPVSNLGKGIYDLRIIVEDEIIWSRRFIK